MQPIAYGAALGIHPLAVLVVTIAGGSLFGAVGLILAAPVTSAVVRVAADLAQARELPTADGGPTVLDGRGSTCVTSGRTVLVPRRGRCV